MVLWIVIRPSAGMAGRLRAVTMMLLVALVTACSSAGGGSDATVDFGRSVEVGGRSVYVPCHGRAAAGAPTVILVAGYHDSSDVWQADAPLPSVRRSSPHSPYRTVSAPTTAPGRCDTSTAHR